MKLFAVAVEGITLIFQREKGSDVVLDGCDRDMGGGVVTCLAMRFWRLHWRCCPYFEAQIRLGGSGGKVSLNRLENL